MTAKRPRIDNEVEEAAKTQFFPPYPEDEDEEQKDEDNGNNESGVTEGGPQIDSRLVFNQNLTVAIARLKEKRDVSSTFELSHSGRRVVAAKSASLRVVNCIVCHRQRSLTEMMRFTANYHKRVIWVDAVRETPEARKSLMDTLTISLGPFLCVSHFLPSDFIGSTTVLKPDAVPFYPAPEVQGFRASDEVELLPQPSNGSNMIQKESVDVKNEHIDCLADIKQEEPIADLFCPSTGNSRPRNPSTVSTCENENTMLLHDESRLARFAFFRVPLPDRPSGLPFFEDTTESSIVEDEPLLNASNEIKQKLVEIKDEPIEEFAEVKQEEPIADLYCPSTGNSRPIDQKDLLSAEKTVRERGIIDGAESDSPMGDKSFACSDCDDKFASHSGLEIHKSYMHKSYTATPKIETSFACSECGKILVSKQGLEYHMGIHFGAENAFPCMKCGKKFRKKQTLEWHNLIHADVKPYSCPYCVSCFRYLSHRNKHIGNVHQKKPYPCRTCDATFDLKSELKKHLVCNQGHIEQEQRSEVNEFSSMTEVDSTVDHDNGLMATRDITEEIDEDPEHPSSSLE